jgi:hypothetical protein
MDCPTLQKYDVKALLFFTNFCQIQLFLVKLISDIDNLCFFFSVIPCSLYYEGQAEESPMGVEGSSDDDFHGSDE